MIGRLKSVIALLIVSGVILSASSSVFASDTGEKAVAKENKQTAATTTKTEAAAVDTKKVSYAIGQNIGQNIKKDFDVDVEALCKGLKDSQEGKNDMTEEEMQKTMASFQNQMREKQMAEMAKAAQANKAAGEAFLKENKTKEGIVTLPSGLQYKIITNGTGAKPTADQKVKCHYKGTTIDGKEFDSSYKRGEPATFQVGGVIKGWTEALLMMPVGSKWMLYIPSDLAYGDRGAGGAIAPGSTLIFEVELIGIE
ncbi:MAG: FKBP-type peptidyl-prolyl cis-trans isomerase [Desulfamplus sp.]|nr:FKBP-type peptidyl-prolyl cis-trans isomerase [Desulfamplus sp.]